MDVDRALIDAAEAALRTGFPHSCGSACATYSSQGRLLTASHESSADLEAISACRNSGELISAMITLAWNGGGSTASVRSPTRAVLEGLQSQARRHARVAVGGTPAAVVVRALWELVLERGTDPWSNPARTQGRFGGGMKAIAGELIELARTRGLARVRAGFPPFSSPCCSTSAYARTRRLRRRAARGSSRLRSSNPSACVTFGSASKWLARPSSMGSWTRCVRS